MSLIRGDARSLPLVDGCVQCCVTSPPYWSLRDYGSPGQIGLEATPDAYVATMVAVFAEVWRVLREDGTCWINLGDSLSAKQLVGIPWRVAFALQAAGWYLRADIIWAKPNPMPESCRDRPTKAHEYIFLLSKSARYLYEADAIKEDGDRWCRTRATFRGGDKYTAGRSFQNATERRPDTTHDGDRVMGRNKRSVWTVPTQPYSGAHFATFPEALIEPCILAGSRPGDLVLDPFIGSGTVGAVCERFGRRWVGTDLSYQGLSTARTAQRGLRFGD